MEKEKCEALIEMFQNIFKLPPSLIIEDEFGCTASAEFQHKNTKIILEISDLPNEEKKEFETSPQTPTIEFHKLKLKNGTFHYIISFYLQNDVVGKYVVRIYIE
jgi:hypothetical protein